MFTDNEYRKSMEAVEFINGITYYPTIHSHYYLDVDLTLYLRDDADFRERMYHYFYSSYLINETFSNVIQKVQQSCKLTINPFVACHPFYGNKTIIPIKQVLDETKFFSYKKEIYVDKNKFNNNKILPLGHSVANFETYVVCLELHTNNLLLINIENFHEWYQLEVKTEMALLPTIPIIQKDRSGEREYSPPIYSNSPSPPIYPPQERDEVHSTRKEIEDCIKFIKENKDEEILQETIKTIFGISIR